MFRNLWHSCFNRVELHVEGERFFFFFFITVLIYFFRSYAGFGNYRRGKRCAFACLKYRVLAPELMDSRTAFNYSASKRRRHIFGIFIYFSTLERFNLFCRILCRSPKCRALFVRCTHTEPRPALESSRPIRVCRYTYF